MILTNHFKHHYSPDITEEKARWALAFYREGLSMRPTPYAFLSLYKIINMLHKGGRHQTAWINASVDAAATRESKKRLEVLRQTHSDIGKYLYESGRCAVAHAGHGTTIDPENPRDMKRLAEDFPLIQDLAAYAIEKEFRIKSVSTIYHEHLYELEGFQRLIGSELAQKLKQQAAVRPDELPRFPSLQVGSHGEKDSPPLLALVTHVTAIEDGVIYLKCASANRHTQLIIGLDFPNERLLTNVFEGLASLDDGSEDAVRNAISLMEFKRRYFLNGELTVKRADTGEVLGRCDPFIPENVDMRGTLKNFDAVVAHLTKLAEGRRGN